jgi:hypothetical protein
MRRNARSGLGETQGDRLADTAVGAGDQYRFGA